MKVNVYGFLSDDAKMIRKKGVMEEQDFENEFDDTDKVALHIVMYNDDYTGTL